MVKKLGAMPSKAWLAASSSLLWSIALRSNIRTYSRVIKTSMKPMPAPYSDDFREKAIEAVQRGERKTDGSRMLNISRNTLV